MYFELKFKPSVNCDWLDTHWLSSIPRKMAMTGPPIKGNNFPRYQATKATNKAITSPGNFVLNGFTAYRLL